MRGKRASTEDIYLRIEWVDPTTPEGKESWDNGFRILAHMIAETHMKRTKVDPEYRNKLAEKTKTLRS